MTHILLYWNHICVLHRQEKAFLQELAGRLHREDIELEVRFFGLGYPEHMSEYLARPDAVLVNPLFYQSPRGRALLREVLRPERVVLYHIPGADRDPWGLRRMVRRQLERSRDEPYHLSALWESLDRMTVTGRGE